MSAPVEQLSPLGHALAGALGGVFSNSVVYPLDTVKTRIQASSAKGKEKKAETSVLKLLVRILKEEGAMAYYNGFGASMLNTFSTQYAYFFFYTLVRNSYIKRLTSKLAPGSKTPSLSTAAELLLGALAGALAQIFTIPVSVIATRQQVGGQPSKQKSSDAASSSGNKPSYADVSNPEKETTRSSTEPQFNNSFLGVGRQIVHEEGITGLWLGLKPSLVLTVNPAITYGVFERVKSLFLIAKEKRGASIRLTPLQAFFIGAVSKTLATVVTYPYIMAKVRIQAGSAGEETLPTPAIAAGKKPKALGAVDLLMKIWKEDGPTGWYQGMSAQITKAVLSQALLFMSKEQFEHHALAIILLSRKLSSST